MSNTPDIINIGAIFGIFPNITRNNIINSTKFNGASGCWLFEGRTTHGYGVIICQGNPEQLHRVVAHLVYDYNMDSPLIVCHERFCPNKNCWNWNHLYIGTLSDNTNDMVATGTHYQAKKLFCPYGHLYDAENTAYTKKGGRFCLTCRKIRNDSRPKVKNV